MLYDHGVFANIMVPVSHARAVRDDYLHQRRLVLFISSAQVDNCGGDENRKTHETYGSSGVYKFI